MKTNHEPFGYGRLKAKTGVICINSPIIELRLKGKNRILKSVTKNIRQIKLSLERLLHDQFSQGVFILDVIDVGAVSLITFSFSIRTDL